MNKYGNRKAKVDGYTFDSLAEMRRYQELKLLEKAGEIRDLSIHPRFDLHVLSVYGSRVKVGTYAPDFRYYSLREPGQVYEDVKSPATKNNATYRLKKRMFEGEYGVQLTEVEA